MQHTWQEQSDIMQNDVIRCYFGKAMGVSACAHSNGWGEIAQAVGYESPDGSLLSLPN